MMTMSPLLGVSRRDTGSKIILGCAGAGPSYSTRWSNDAITYSSDITDISLPICTPIKVGSNWFTVSSDSKFWKSTDQGATWTWVGSVGADPLCMTFDRSKFYVGRVAHAMSISTDATGTSWTNSTIAGITGNTFSAMYTGTAVFIATDDGYLRSTTNAGSSWDSQPFPGGNLLGLDYFASQSTYLAGKVGGAGAQGIRASTTLASPWDHVQDSGSELVYAFAHSPTHAVAVGSNTGRGIIYNSSNGTSWALRMDEASRQFFDVTYSGSLGLFVAVGGSSATSGGLVWTSPTGETWTERVSGAGVCFIKVGSA